jgi:hypothetical protein
MKNKLHLVQKIVRLTRTWVPTGDAKNPLACVWVEAGTQRAVSAAPAGTEAGRLHLCA